MKELSIRKEAYEDLCRELTKILEEGRKKAVAAVSVILIETYWEMGRRLSEERLSVDRGEVTQFFERLGADLGVGRTVIHNAWNFYRTYPDGLPDDPAFRRLSWGTHTALLPIVDEEKRTFYLERAIEEGWSRSTLRKAIRADLYRAHKGAGDYETGRLSSPDRELHNYAGVVERVVDGDTIEVRIDLGFDVWRVETIRLRGVDAAELGTKQGRQAKKFVEQRLASAPFVGLKTYKTDKYARYIADVFYHDKKPSSPKAFEHGVFLNQELIDEGLAGILHLPV